MLPTTITLLLLLVLLQAGASKGLKDRGGRQPGDCAREGLARRPLWQQAPAQQSLQYWY